MKVKKGDKVKVIAGKHKGTTGEVVAVYPRRDRVVVDSVNVKKRSLKKTEAAENDNFVYIQHPIHISNVKLVEEKETKVAKSASKEKKSTKSATKKTTKTKSNKTSK